MKAISKYTVIGVLLAVVATLSISCKREHEVSADLRNQLVGSWTDSSAVYTFEASATGDITFGIKYPDYRQGHGEYSLNQDSVFGYVISNDKVQNNITLMTEGYYSREKGPNTIVNIDVVSNNVSDTTFNFLIEENRVEQALAGTTWQIDFPTDSTMTYESASSFSTLKKIVTE